ncbi:hypothetical protein FCK90_14910 [Kocuria coralli]|uniref:Uncharacterized protein n=1 Tax=Kocuria coralli TaxID=1461025 RepID=A0A5J5KT83_9MICC|nr:hypothetical protein [Kocuria coralli]KAA9392929.1 hypothetical protein FCK90_14910 [Kocuria coralli]
MPSTSRSGSSGGPSPLPRTRKPGPAPTPARMAGRKDPALSVRPVDITAATRDHARRLAGRPAPAEGDTPSFRPGRPGPAPSEQQAGRSRLAAQRAARDRAQLARRIESALEANTSRSLDHRDSLYSVVSGRPVPTGEQLRLDAPEGDVHVVGAWDATLADLQWVIQDPDDSWSADLGRTDYFLRGDLCVQIQRADAQIVGIYRAGWALARRPQAPLPQEPGSGPSASRGKGTRYPTNQRELLQRLRSAGFVVVTSGPTHGKITHPDHPGRFLPFSSTPSGQRYGRHVVTAVKRVFGIDLRG